MEQRIHVQPTGAGTVTQEVKDTLKPAHKLVKQSIIVLVYFVNEFVELVFVTGTEINESLDSLVGICGDFLPLTSLNCFDRVVYKYCKIGDTAVDIGRFVDADKRLIEDCEQVPEKL